MWIEASDTMLTAGWNGARTYTILLSGEAEEVGVDDMEVMRDDELMGEGDFCGGQLAALCEAGTSLHLCNMYNNV